MAQRSIREYDAKMLISKHIRALSGGRFNYDGKAILVTAEKPLKLHADEHKWVKEMKLVAKPDHMFGKRGKSGLLLVNAYLDEIDKWIDERMNREIEIKGAKGRLSHFIAEPYYEHQNEYYLAFTAHRNGDRIHFSKHGGIDIESHWDKVKTADIPVDIQLNELNVSALTMDITESKREELNGLIICLYSFFRKLHFTFLEFNPFSVKDGMFMPMDCVAKVDDTAGFLCRDEWNGLEFPSAFGLVLSEEEKHMRALDEKSGASLKLTVLNPSGRAWTMTAGGGASVIYADTIVDKGFGNELANYGEYSGNPTTDETAEYARTILKLMTDDGNKKGKVLIIGGGIANFTDVSKTFDGIIRAFREYADRINEYKIKVFVRRGGPNYVEGLEKLRKAGADMNIKMEVYGPEMHMTRIAVLALNSLKGAE